MFNPYNVNIERLKNQRQEIDNLINNYQHMPQQQQPMNVFNVGNNPQIEFEARMVGENDKPNEILVQRRTAFINLKNGLLSIKETNGDIKEYPIVLPKTPEQIENEQLKLKLKEMELKLNELSNNSANNEKSKSKTNAVKQNEPTAKTNG